jgi:predicted Zn-dependent peptidase
MIEFEQFHLGNGLKVIVHQDHSTPMAVLNVLYDVGAKDEDPHKTGFAHLFEHLMFGGSIHIADFETPLQMAGGENNAFTTNDLTNYYLQLPAKNLETAFWLESDRMVSLAFSEKSLDVQRKVVCEEFKEHYLNKPYGDAWFKIRELAYHTHPYQWMTIGKQLQHIEQAKLGDVKEFFFKHYRPSNAILVVAGPVKTEEVRRLAEKWFGDIPAGQKYVRHLPTEPPQTQARSLEVKANVPLDALYKCYHMAARTEQDYYYTDLATEVLGSGSSSRLYQRLVKEKKLFSQIECYHTGSTDPGLVVIEGKIIKGIPMQQASEAIDEELMKITAERVEDKELIKAKNKTESAIQFEDMSLVNRASSLAMYELLGNANLMNEELSKYQAASPENLLDACRQVFDPKNSCTLYYYSNS